MTPKARIDSTARVTKLGTVSFSVLNHRSSGPALPKFLGRFILLIGLTILCTTGFSVTTPTFSPDGGTYATTVSVAIACFTSGAVIHYTTNGVDPTENDPVVASGSAVLIGRNLTLKAKAWAAGSRCQSRIVPVDGPDCSWCQSQSRLEGRRDLMELGTKQLWSVRDWEYRGPVVSGFGQWAEQRDSGSRGNLP